MKKILSLIALMIFSATQFSFAQKTLTEATVVYKMNMTGPGMDDPQAAAMLQNMMVSNYFKNGKFASVMDMGIMKTRTIMKSDGNFVTLMDMMGQKFKIAMDKAQYTDKKKVKDSEYDVRVTEEKKVIAGYNCTKSIIMTKKGKSFDVWLTNEITGDASKNIGPYSKVNGMLMQYSMEEKGNTITMTCQSVDFSPVSDEVFTIPEGYTEMTLDQMAKMGM